VAPLRRRERRKARENPYPWRHLHKLISLGEKFTFQVSRWSLVMRWRTCHQTWKFCLTKSCMVMSRNRDDFVLHFEAEGPKDYHFLLDPLHETYDINFEDILNMFNVYQHGNYLIILWALHQTKQYSVYPTAKLE
jgi:hypothetical protein